MVSLHRVFAGVTMVSGFLWALLPFIQQLTQFSREFDVLLDIVAIGAPLALLSGVYGLGTLYTERFTSESVIIGLGLLTVGLLGFAGFAAYEVLSLSGLPTGLIFSGIGLVSILAAEGGALLLAYRDWRSDESPGILMVLLSVALPLNILLLNSVLTRSIFYFAGGLYGLAWVAIGLYLWSATKRRPCPRPS